MKKEVERHVGIIVEDNGPGFDATMMAGRHRTGLNIIRQTLAVINERNKDKVSFRMHNKTDSEGNM